MSYHNYLKHIPTFMILISTWKKEKHTYFIMAAAPHGFRNEIKHNLSMERSINSFLHVPSCSCIYWEHNQCYLLKASDKPRGSLVYTNSLNGAYVTAI